MERKESLADYYDRMMTLREPYITRGARNAEYTIPYVLRRYDTEDAGDLPLPWESTGAELVNNLTNKIAQSLFPQGLPWVRLKASRKVTDSLADMNPNQKDALLKEIQAALSVIERDTFVDAVAEDGDIVALIKTIRHLLVVGNYCLQITDTGLKGRNLHRYITERDQSGELIRAIILDKITYTTAPEDVKDIVRQYSILHLDDKTEEELAARPVEVYTDIRLVEGTWEVHQEVLGMEVEGSRAEYTHDTLPYIFCVYDLNENEDYGRSYVELSIADLTALDGQSQNVQQATTVGSKLVRLVRPGSMTSKDALSKADTGDIISGVETDIGVVNSAGYAPNFQGSMAIQDRIRARLSRAFLMTAGQMRQAERVTAEEVRFLARQLEEQLGGAYAQQVKTLQLPYARLKLTQLKRQGRIPPIDKQEVDMIVITGAAALSRQAKAEALLRGLGAIGQFAPQYLQERLNVEALVDVLTSAEGYNYEGLFISEEDYQQRRESQMMEQAAIQAAPEVARQVGNNNNNNNGV